MLESPVGNSHQIDRGIWRSRTIYCTLFCWLLRGSADYKEMASDPGGSDSHVLRTEESWKRFVCL